MPGASPNPAQEMAENVGIYMGEWKLGLDTTCFKGCVLYLKDTTSYKGCVWCFKTTLQRMCIVF